MADSEVTALIARMRTGTGADLARAGAVSLINLIPFAGGAVASVVGEYASHRKMEKVCDVLSHLNSTLEAHGSDPERHLSKDQIVEVVHETLLTSATTSDDAKLAALKGGLCYAFLAEDPFERKQVFLQVLRGATVLELTTMRLVYHCEDPHVVLEGGPRCELDGPGAGAHLVSGPHSTLGRSALASVVAGRWQFVKNEERGRGNLLSFLATTAGLDEGMTAGVLQLLDSKGLTSSSGNLDRTASKVMKWVPFSDGQANFAGGFSSGYSFEVARPSPLEATRTKFGAEFLRVLR